MEDIKKLIMKELYTNLYFSEGDFLRRRKHLTSSDAYRAAVELEAESRVRIQPGEQPSERVYVLSNAEISYIESLMEGEDWNDNQPVH